MAPTETLSPAKRKLAELLKRNEAATAPDLAVELGLTTQAVRQHLAELEEHGLVEQHAPQTRGPGRPPVTWTLTELAATLFPDRHADLTVDLIAAVRRALGEQGLEQVIEVRRRDQLRIYKRVVPGTRTPLLDRVSALARQRTAEGYMAEARADDDGSCLLIEHHCPVCEAATACMGLCRAELEVFRDTLGTKVTVTRERHLLAGDTRCVYRIRKSGESSRG